MPRYRPAYYQLGASPLLGDEAEFEGDVVGAVVVAVNEEVCKKALAAIKVDWEVLPFILDPREAAKPGAPILRPEMNPDSNMTGNTFGAAVEWELGLRRGRFQGGRPHRGGRTTGVPCGASSAPCRRRTSPTGRTTRGATPTARRCAT